MEAARSTRKSTWSCAPKCIRAVVDDTDSPEAHAEIQRIAEEDWETDRQGHDHLDYNRFTRAWFQLADHWTHDLSPESYEKFLTNIFVSLTERGVTGILFGATTKIFITMILMQTTLKRKASSAQRLWKRMSSSRKKEKETV